MKAIVVEAAVLIEANWMPLVDQVWVVVASEAVVVDRLAKQRNLAPGSLAVQRSGANLCEQPVQ
jgi:dephospho-CoA kinase